ncbi:pseudouridine synthase [Abyssisolibacter fermentans]|uniref:pseudouridine synthase n=1 Tax=Abyssisolibacter fermentans TaxID=1766203 RepID=UPI000ACA97FC|nr:pseudouridine synthase [Abyssisolibacter fermentans]
MRLQKYLALCGVASRRKSEKLILEGKIKVNGEIITTLGFKINPEKDSVMVNDKKIAYEQNIYIMLNKPVKYITSASDQFNRPTVLDLVKLIDTRIYPVGRLDYHTSGLILLTNDGELTYKLTHPKHNIWKKYIAKVKGIPTELEMKKFKTGLKIENYTTARAKIKILDVAEKNSELEILIKEGRNRQVRKMCEAINHPVIKLKRVSIGDINLGKLQVGEWRFLNEKELKYLKEI